MGVKCNCVYPLIITSHESVGGLELRMPLEEILAAIYEMQRNWEPSDETEIQVAADDPTYGYTVRYRITTEAPFLR